IIGRRSFTPPSGRSLAAWPVSGLVAEPARRFEMRHADGGHESAYPSSSRAWWSVSLLTLGAILSYTDRLILTILVDPVRASLHLTDTQLSVVQGAAFAVIYSCIGLPLGRVADLVPQSAPDAGHRSLERRHGGLRPRTLVRRAPGRPIRGRGRRSSAGARRQLADPLQTR